MTKEKIQWIQNLRKIIRHIWLRARSSSITKQTAQNSQALSLQENGLIQIHSLLSRQSELGAEDRCINRLQFCSLITLLEKNSHHLRHTKDDFPLYSTKNLMHQIFCITISTDFSGLPLTHSTQLFCPSNSEHRHLSPPKPMPTIFVVSKILMYSHFWDKTHHLLP